jgi:hypothetical protein
MNLASEFHVRQLCLFAIVLLSFSLMSHAQTAEVYATANFTHLSNVEVAAFSVNGDQSHFYKSMTPVSFGGGVTVNFLRLPVVRLGADFRGSTRSGLNGADTALGGVKLTLRPMRLKPKFFIEAAAGYLATRADSTGTYTTTTSSYTFSVTSVGPLNNHYSIYEIIGGIDYPITRFLDFRIEAAGGSSFGNNYVFQNYSGSNVKVLTVDSGFVIHF